MAIFKFDVENQRFAELNNSKIDEQSLGKMLYARRETDLPIVKFGDAYHIDISTNEIFYNNEKLKLTKKESAIFRLFVAKIV